VSPYSGAPWRSRYLRAPKAALALADRDDFAPLGALATVRLGLKTGADGFFLLAVVDDDGKREQREMPLRPGRTVRVRGLNGWQGYLDRRDLAPVVRNPQALSNDRGRALTIPKDTRSVYLLPRPGSPDQYLQTYLRFGEMEGVHQSRLVRDNAGGGPWWRQTRAVARPAIALPYNSAYDYGAWRNPHGAAINGRFVGVDPLDGIDPELLCAVLNSTWTLAGRLLEGVATGTEGAYDVGPVAARLIRIPDPRKFQPHGLAAIEVALRTIRESDLIPAAPDRDGRVVGERHRLDLAVMQALGIGVGEASAEAGRLYESYGRWRAAVEDVERRMRGLRGAMGRMGLGRGATPSVAAARRIWDELAPDRSFLPRDLIHDGDALVGVEVPGRLIRLVDRPLLDDHIVASKEGDSVDVGSWERARYIYMLSELGFHSPFAVPAEAERAAQIHRAFEQESATLRALARARARYFVNERIVDEVVEEVVRLWHRHCRTAGQGVLRSGLIH